MKLDVTLPWTHKIVPSHVVGRDVSYVVDGEHRLVAGSMLQWADAKEIDAHKLIVQRTNAYMPLVKSLQASVRNHCPHDRMYCSTCSPARALLKALGENENVIAREDEQIVRDPRK